MLRGFIRCEHQAYSLGVLVEVDVGVICRVGAGVGSPPEHAVESATGRKANRKTATTALFNHDRMLCIGSLYLPVRLSSMVLCE